MAVPLNLLTVFTPSNEGVASNCPEMGQKNVTKFEHRAIDLMPESIEIKCGDPHLEKCFRYPGGTHHLLSSAGGQIFPFLSWFIA